jgi:hypothetical protein
MPKSVESINKDLEDLLVAKGYDVTALDSSGKEVPVADSAELFTFHFHRNGRDYGTVTATIDGLQKLTIYYDDEVAKSGSSEAGGEEGTSWISLLKQLKKFAQRHQLGFVLKDTDRLRSDMKRRIHTKKLEEGRVKELQMDLKDMTDEEFMKAYNMTKKEARAELKPKKQVAEGEKQSKSREMDLDWHYKNIINTKGLSDKAKKDTTDIYNKLKKKKEQGVAEAGSNAMADTAKRLANKDDGKVAKLRAAGDKRREEELKGRNIAKRNESVDLKTSLQELSNDMLGKYKKAASADASKADKEGNVKRGDKRFSGIVKATNKQFANDAKKTK